MTTVLITGASSGIGKSLAERFAQAGHQLILVAREEKKLLEVARRLKKQYGVSILPISQDLSQDDAAKIIYQKVKTAGLSPDFLINNAGFGDHNPFVSADLDKQVKMIKTNNLALISLTHYFLDDMLKRDQQTAIVNIASIASFQPGPYMSIYHASKALVLSFSLALAEELRGTKVRVKAICPGPTKTGFEQEAGQGASKLFRTFDNSSPDDIALFIERELAKKRVVAIPGWRNRVLVWLSRAGPLSLTTRFVGRIMTNDTPSH